MKKGIGVFCVLALSAVCLLSVPAKSTLAAGAELPENFKEIKEQEARMGLNDVVRSYSSYQGSTVSITYTERQSNGDTYYYKGTLSYIGRGYKGSYEYLGDKRDFDLYKIVKSDGTVINPKSL